MKIKIPEQFMGKPVEGAMERFLKGNPSPVALPEQAEYSQTNFPNIKGYIHVPSINLSFAEERSLYGKTWYDTHKALIPRRLRMPTIKETEELIFYLKNNLSDPRLKKVYDDILKITPKDTWHGEWQNNIFSKDSNGMYTQRVIGLDKKGELILSAKEKLENCLNSDGWADFSSKSKLTSQGLCKESSNLSEYKQGDNIYFWYPRDERVARFDVDSGGASLNCDGGPGDSDSSLGVRACAEGAVAKK